MSNTHQAKTPVKQRRNQKERTATTRAALIEAAIRAIHRDGYAGATMVVIAEEAGVTRGAILHHFGSRASMMASVIDDVFHREMAQYDAILSDGTLGQNIYDWPHILWSALSMPPGVAVLEILLAARSDPELNALVADTQTRIEADALGNMRGLMGGDADAAKSLMRLMVWSARGLSIANMILPDRDATNNAINLLSQLLQFAAPSGSTNTLTATLSGLAPSTDAKDPQTHP